jgi:hypothetical protein
MSILIDKGVMAVLVTAIHADTTREITPKESKIHAIRIRRGRGVAWMPATSAGMTALLTWLPSPGG